MSTRLTAAPGGGDLKAEQIRENFKDLHIPLSRTQAMVESARCLYCYDAPCIKACPTSIDIPTFIQQIRSENLKGSAKTILSSNIFGGTCSRVCPTESLCEGCCVKHQSGEDPIQIGRLQRYAVDSFFNLKSEHPFSRQASTGKKAALVGAGPAGLACAHRLAMNGHDVTVFEARPKSGGLNEYGLAAYKMVDDFARKEVDFLLEIGGITLKQGQALGRDISLESLRQDFDVVFMAVGLGNVNNLNIPGEELPGLKDSIAFIETIRQAEDITKIKPGHEVLVIGGGNTAIDAAVQAKRLGARKVTMVYRRGPEEMSATQWEQDLAKSNDVHMEYWAKPVKITMKDNKLKVEFERTLLKKGLLTGSGETFVISSDSLLKAIGQTLKPEDLQGLTLEKGKIKVNERYETNLKGVFAGGDCIASGEDLTVQAVADGNQAADAIDKYLRGEK